MHSSPHSGAFSLENLLLHLLVEGSEVVDKIGIYLVLVVQPIIPASWVAEGSQVQGQSR